MGEIVYVRMKRNLRVNPTTTIKLKELAYITGKPSLIKEIENTYISQTTNSAKHVVVIDGFTVINKLVQLYPNIEFQQIGPTQTILHMQKSNKKSNMLLVSLIWLLLFIGSAMAIMNFHYDVSMQEVQQKLHFLLTGEETQYPLWIQIPYSIGLGGGMILFFNHLFKKRFNEEPSPLEIELFKYQQDIDNYVTYYETNVKDANRHTD